MADFSYGTFLKALIFKRYPSLSEVSVFYDCFRLEQSGTLGLVSLCRQIHPLLQLRHVAHILGHMARFTGISVPCGAPIGTHGTFLKSRPPEMAAEIFELLFDSAEIAKFAQRR